MRGVPWLQSASEDSTASSWAGRHVVMASEQHGVNGEPLVSSLRCGTGMEGRGKVY